MVALSEDDPELLTPLYLPGRAFVDVGETAKGIQLLGGVQYLDNSALKPGDPVCLTVLHNLATAYLEAGRVEEAIILLTEVVRIEEMKLKPENPERQASEKLLADALRQRDNGQKNTPSG